ncbi:mechanosensitive ion channel domain-containing protein [Hartmannibacter diazotrophicus]|nr:mechanosensitive ion channel domain-containing protein [Hartmannibacter diazotrophicus]
MAGVEPASAETVRFAQFLPSAVTPSSEPADAAEGSAEADVKAAQDALIKVLKDDKARALFLEELQKTAPAATETAAPVTGASQPAETPKDGAAVGSANHQLTEKVSEYTREFGSDIIEILVRTWTSLLNLRTIFDGSVSIDWASLSDRLTNVAQLIVVTVVAVLGLRLAARPGLRGLDRLAGRSKSWRKVLPIVLGAVLQWLPMAIATVIGVAFAFWRTTTSQLDNYQTLFLSAFVMAQMFRIGLNVLLRPKYDNLRLLPFSRELAVFWTPRLGLLISLVAYGLLFVGPLVSYTISFRLGIGVRAAVVVIAVIFAFVLVLRNRTNVARELVAASGRVHSKSLANVLVRLSKVWHWLIIAYVLLAFAIWSARPTDALNFLMNATLLTILAITVGGMLNHLLSDVIKKGVRMPESVRTPLPLLERRVNVFVPAIVGFVRLLLYVVVLAVTLHFWHVIDLLTFVNADNFDQSLFRRILSAFFILVTMLAVWLAVTSWIEFRLNPNQVRAVTPRVRTILALLRNAVTVLILIIALMLSLSELGVDIAPLIASAGVVGLAIGFGSQKLVQDIITGMFIQLENAMNEGDVVTVGGISGVVEHLTIRSVGLRDLDGVYHVVPFSSVDSVSNFMRGFSYHVCEMGVAYRENIAEVKKLMFHAFDRLMQTDHGASILDPLDMHGVTSFGDNAVMVRARIRTTAGQQWAVGRAYNEILKEVFDEYGIEIPFPQRTIWFGEPKSGEAPPLHFSGSVKSREDSQRPPVPETEAKGPPPVVGRPPSETLDVPESPDDR